MVAHSIGHSPSLQYFLCMPMRVALVVVRLRLSRSMPFLSGGARARIAFRAWKESIAKESIVCDATKVEENREVVEAGGSDEKGSHQANAGAGWCREVRRSSGDGVKAQVESLLEGKLVGWSGKSESTEAQVCFSVWMMAGPRSYRKL